MKTWRKLALIVGWTVLAIDVMGGIVSGLPLETWKLAAWGIVGLLTYTMIRGTINSRRIDP